MFGRVVVAGLALAMPCSVAVNEEEGPDFFDSYAKNTNGLTGIYSYTVEPAEDCGISIVLYGTRMQLDLDVTELVDGEEEVVRRCSARRAECSHLLARHPL
jgi:hypothetical protein